MMEGTQQLGPSSFELLPLEIRHQIYRYLLPYSLARRDTKMSRGWRLGNTAILALNRQIHEEAAELMYGDSCFYFDVDYKCIDSEFLTIKRSDNPWNIDSGRRQARMELFRDIGPKNVSRIGHLQVCIFGPEAFDEDPGYLVARGIEADKPAYLQFTPKGYQATINALVDQMSTLSKLLKPIRELRDLRVTVVIDRQEPDV